MNDELQQLRAERATLTAQRQYAESMIAAIVGDVRRQSERIGTLSAEIAALEVAEATPPDTPTFDLTPHERASREHVAATVAGNGHPEATA